MGVRTAMEGHLVNSQYLNSLIRPLLNQIFDKLQLMAGLKNIPSDYIRNESFGGEMLKEAVISAIAYFIMAVHCRRNRAALPGDQLFGFTFTSTSSAAALLLKKVYYMLIFDFCRRLLSSYLQSSLNSTVPSRRNQSPSSSTSSSPTEKFRKVLEWTDKLLNGGDLLNFLLYIRWAKYRTLSERMFQLTAIPLDLSSQGSSNHTSNPSNVKLDSGGLSAAAEKYRVMAGEMEVDVLNRTQVWTYFLSCLDVVYPHFISAYHNSRKAITRMAHQLSAVDDADKVANGDDQVRRLSDEDIDEVETDSLNCPICKDAVNIPCINFVCGHVYCWYCIHRYCLTSPNGFKCPCDGCNRSISLDDSIKQLCHKDESQENSQR